MTSLKITVLRAAAPLPTSAGAALMEDDDGLISAAIEEQHEFLIMDDDKYACKITLIADAVAGVGMTVKSCVKVEEPNDGDGGGGLVVKVESSYHFKLLRPVPSVEVENKEIAETHDRINAETESNEVGAPNFKVKMD